MAKVISYGEGLNHHPAHPGIWVPYNKQRMKDRYDVKLKTGEVWQYYYPNADTFAKWTSAHDGPERIHDDEIAEIRQIPDEEITEKYFFSGEERIKRNIKMFGDIIPKVEIVDGVPVITPVRLRKFDDWVVSSLTGERGMWMHEEELSVEELKASLADEALGDVEPDTVVGRCFSTYFNLLCSKANYHKEELTIPWAGTSFEMNVYSPMDYQRKACLIALEVLEKMVEEEFHRGAITAAGRNARKQAVTAAISGAGRYLHAALDRKTSGEGKNEKDGRYVTKREMRNVDGKQLTGKQLRKLQKKQRRDARVESVDETE